LLAVVVLDMLAVVLVLVDLEHQPELPVVVRLLKRHCLCVLELLTRSQ
jgi:hypothetical protein